MEIKNTYYKIKTTAKRVYASIKMCCNSLKKHKITIKSVP